MKNRILMIIPTRERNDKHIELIQSYLETSSQTFVDLLFVLDEDDQANYKRYPIDPEALSISNEEMVLEYSDLIQYLVIPRIRMIPALNYAAQKFCHQYKYIGFMGDDHRFKTDNWDKQIMNDLDHNSVNGMPSIVYGNDLLQGANLPTAVIMSSDVIQVLGFMVPLTFIHMYADNFWLRLGNDLGSLKYYDDVIIEHMHYTNGKADADEMYKNVNSGHMFERDGREFNEYFALNYEHDLDKLKRHFQL